MVTARRRPAGRRLVLALLTLAAVQVRAADVAQVHIRDSQFVPPTLTVKVGTTVRWTNGERRTSHSVVLALPQRLESDRMLPGESWEHLFDKPGTYDYTCGPHPEMKGRLVVTE